MDAFYASVEALDDPSVAGRPLIVGGTGRRGVVASCSYEARAYGIHSAMPSVQARRLCPGAVFLPGRYDRYVEVSRGVHRVLRDFTPLIEGISLDEAFMDVTGSLRLFGPPAAIAEAIRSRIASELHLACSVGVAPVKFLAKLASEAAKPRAGGEGVTPGAGVVVVEPGEELAFLHPLPIESLWGVGPATSRRLRALGLSTVGDLASVPAPVLETAVGRSAGAHLASLARGVDDRAVEPDREVKSVSHEETYSEDRFDPAGLRVEVVRMSDSVAARLRGAGLAGRTVNLKVRYGDFTTRTRSRTTDVFLCDGPVIAAHAADLLAGVDLSAGVRLLGVGVSNLTADKAGPAQQLSLDLEPAGAEPEEPTGSPPPGRVASASGAVDAIRARFGPGSVGPAALVAPEGLRVKVSGDTQWGPAPGTGTGSVGAKFEGHGAGASPRAPRVEVPEGSPAS
jgi:DNA polymerase-4